MNFSAEMGELKLQLKFTFTHSTIMEGSEIVVSLRNDNETLSCNGNFYEGDVQRVSLQMGQMTKLSFYSEKLVYLPSIRMCRKKPYTDTLYNNLLKNVHKNCTMPCKPDSDFGFCYALRQSKEIDRLPFCMDKNDTECFYQNFDLTVESLNIYSGPCTKLQHLMMSKYDFPSQDPTIAELHVIFDPPRTTVMEQYLIYDMVALISAIGGTMGLSIGFSFTHFTSTTLKLVEHMVTKTQNAIQTKTSQVTNLSHDKIIKQLEEQEKINAKMQKEIASIKDALANPKISRVLAAERDKLAITDID